MYELRARLSLAHIPAERAGNSRGEVVGIFMVFGGQSQEPACDRAPWVSWQEEKLLLLVGRAVPQPSCNVYGSSRGCRLHLLAPWESQLPGTAVSTQMV